MNGLIDNWRSLSSHFGRRRNVRQKRQDFTVSWRLLEVWRDLVGEQRSHTEYEALEGPRILASSYWVERNPEAFLKQSLAWG